MKSVAVVGGGIAGLTAAWAMRSAAEVTLYEAADRLGGHAHSHAIYRAGGTHDIVDTGFIVMNYKTYPTLVRLFGELGVATQPTEMSMSVSCKGCGLEYAGARGLAGLLGSGAAAGNRRYWRLLSEVPHFHRAARALLTAASQDDMPFRAFLNQHRFSEYFTNHFAVPLVACVWSCPPGVALDYPARYLFSFLDNHGMLRIRRSPDWHTVVGGSRSYVDRIADAVNDIRLNTAVAAITRHQDHVSITTREGATHDYESAVIATHPDQALSMLTEATPLERDVLGAFDYSPNLVELHSDESLLPRIPRARASWNYQMPSCSPPVGMPVAVTYDMNRLQHIDSPNRYLVSLNARLQTDPKTVRRRMNYAHPQYTPRSVAAQRRLPQLNSVRLAFAGAYHGWGFHEDGARSGVSAARSLGSRW